MIPFTMSVLNKLLCNGNLCKNIPFDGYLIIELQKNISRKHR